MKIQFETHFLARPMVWIATMDVDGASFEIVLPDNYDEAGATYADRMLMVNEAFAKMVRKHAHTNKVALSALASKNTGEPTP